MVIRRRDKINRGSVVEPERNIVGVFVDVDTNIKFIVFREANLLEPVLFFDIVFFMAIPFKMWL